MLLLGVLTLALLPGCKKGPAPKAEYRYSVFVEGTTIESLEIGGNTLKPTSTTGRGASFKLTLPSAKYLVDESPKVTLTTTCGSTVFAGKITVGIIRGTSHGDEDGQRRETTDALPEVTATVDFEGPLHAKVFVDRDGKPAASVAVGATLLDPKSESTELLLGTCPTARTIQVDGAPVGTLDWPAPKNKTDVPVGFIDAAGGHCYERITHTYVTKDTTISPYANLGSTTKLEGKRGYVEAFDDFLKPSPDHVTTTDGMDSRYEIRRCATLAKPVPKPTARPRH